MEPPCCQKQTEKVPRRYPSKYMPTFQSHLGAQSLIAKVLLKTVLGIFSTSKSAIFFAEVNNGELT